MIGTQSAQNEQVMTIGSFDAKTKFAELLRNVENGATYLITRNGKTVAQLQGKVAIRQSEQEKAFARLTKRAESFTRDSFTVSEIMEMKNNGRKY